MEMTCPRCGEILQYSRLPPRYCSYCGRPMSTHVQEATAAFPHPTQTPNLGRRGLDPECDPERIGGYRLVRPLGSGGMGTVYEAEEIASGRRVALKLIRPEFADSQETVERFRREGRLAGTIAHPRCVFVLAADEEAGRPYIVMELMPGINLQELVDRQGPLPPQETVARILDVIEGLQEAHRCGLIHRDVKPSNCFLDSENRVKVGDFGLSKSLMLQDAQLTQSGAFMGTLLYAAPEQIRNDPVDHQADIYSVSATLYFLLTGRAPFQGEDAAATLARTMSDPLTPMRQLRPSLPRTLDAIVSRGLARGRERRWQSLEELRLALLPFVQNRQSLGEVGGRVAAYLIDFLFLAPLVMGLSALLRWVPLQQLVPGLDPTMLLSFLASLGCGLPYFVLFESLAGYTPGKYLLRLRVRTVRHHDRPGWPRALLRALLFYLCLDLAPFLVGLVLATERPLLITSRPGSAGSEFTGWMLLLVMLLSLLPVLGEVLGVLLMASTMRRRNGYRGLHEFLSGTQTIRLPAPRRERGFPARKDWREVWGVGRAKESSAWLAPRPSPLVPPPGVPERVGTFTIQKILSWSAEGGMALAEDAVLGRQVWIRFRPTPWGALPAGRREVVRVSRPRWLASGRLDGLQWDAFVAAPGCTLPELVAGRKRLLWPDALYLLDQLTEELTAACRDGTLPECLSPQQIWVQNSGRVQLLDTPLSGPARGPNSACGNGTDGQHHALALLRQAGCMMLEGSEPAEGAVPRRVRAPLPGQAADLLARLQGVGKPIGTMEEFHAQLERVCEQPAEVGRARRGLHLILLAVALAPGLCWMLAVGPLVMIAQLFTSVTMDVQGQAILVQLRRLAFGQGGGLAAAPDPFTRATLLLTLDENFDRERRFVRQQEELKQQQGQLLASSSWFLRQALDKLITSPAFLDQIRQGTQGTEAGLWQEPAPVGAPLEMGDYLQDAGGVLLIPGLWLLWALLTRGGLSFRLAGIVLVQADGQRAARWRCGWRAFLVWAPIAGLLLLSVETDLWRQSYPSAATWTPWVAWLAWWLALALLPLYLWLTQRSPSRGWHDHLAGTYLVPR